jgi:carbonic anhydrase
MCSSESSRPTYSRRTFLAYSSAATVGALGMALPWRQLHAIGSIAANQSAMVPTRFSSPQAALDALYAGNARFVDGTVSAPNRDMERLREVAGGQRPLAAFLGCADSRVPIEIVFDQGFGDLFVTRIAGNVADPAIIGSLEYGTEVLGAQVLFVLGHTKCGAVSATAAGAEVPGQISTLYQHLRRAVKETSGNVEKAIIRNVELQAEILREASPVIAKRLSEGSLMIAGGVYDLETGRVIPVQV